jgi:hypothetical protein
MHLMRGFYHLGQIYSFQKSNEKLCEKQRPYGIVCQRQNGKRRQEKLCEKKKRQPSSTMPLYGGLRETPGKVM